MWKTIFNRFGAKLQTKGKQWQFVIDLGNAHLGVGSFEAVNYDAEIKKLKSAIETKDEAMKLLVSLSSKRMQRNAARSAQISPAIPILFNHNPQEIIGTSYIRGNKFYLKFLSHAKITIEQILKMTDGSVEIMGKHIVDGKEYVALCCLHEISILRNHG